MQSSLYNLQILAFIQKFNEDGYPGVRIFSRERSI